MDYTADPDGGGFYGLSNLSPNQHDYDELDTVYSHLDSSNTAGARAGVFKKKTYVLRVQ